MTLGCLLGIHRGQEAKLEVSTFAEQQWERIKNALNRFYDEDLEDILTKAFVSGQAGGGFSNTIDTALWMVNQIKFAHQQPEPNLGAFAAGELADFTCKLIDLLVIAKGHVGNNSVPQDLMTAIEQTFHVYSDRIESRIAVILATPLARKLSTAGLSNTDALIEQMLSKINALELEVRQRTDDARIVQAELQGIFQVAEKTFEFIESKKSSVDSANQEVEKLLAATKKSTKEIGIGGYANHFHKDYQMNNIASYVWLAIAALLGAYTFNFALDNLVIVESQTISGAKISLNSFSAFVYIFGHAALFAVLYYLLLFSIRNFRTHKHNSIVNRHRANSLKTLDILLASGADNGKVLEAAMPELVKALFHQGQIGYLPKENDSDGPDGLVEIINKVSPIKAPGGS